jgi:DNA-directed RNA polymerase subunit alpha
MNNSLSSFTHVKIMSQPQFTIKTENLSSSFGKFIIEPLPQGYGDTLGNALRRVLYTSIPGAAITSVTIDGTRHQFSTLEGVEEDVVQIILALKQVHLSYSGETPVQITLSAKGPGIVTAKNFETGPEVVIANPELIIAHLSDKSSKLDLEATVESGFGYSPAEYRKSTTVGVIPTDASFSPVMRVNYLVEATRVGRVTNFDKLILDVTTDGTMNPQAALKAAASTLVEYFQGVVNPSDAPAASLASSGSKSAAGSSISVEELDLPTRITNALQRAGFATIADLLAVPAAELAKVKNLGGKSVKVIEEALKERGFDLSQ